ncbi:replication-relaxation family protein [Sulfitobacter sp. SK011]|uniref:replication-relaxation family protein n=1 Tax=Sulfitobacter sp. SK011 TaxID=1389004 RepID=UPI000E0ADDC8|nr:replication-relaxation family protein [Sulfitobacter sp. SK011]AXI40716.1 hypothetical protein C1J02_01115 [Sulfitobacter sp. SK011]AXI40765.1 hypothetical protein C1J02_01430 [Sulfitobacter sp. SK011]
MSHTDSLQHKKKTDSLGRATFHHIVPLADVRPTPREIRWFKHIERHGPLNSAHLHALTKDTHRCRDTSLRQLQKLRAGGFLMLPRQQRFTEHADFNPYIYDLTKQARAHLIDLGLAEPAVRPTGHWGHGAAVSSVTSAIEIAAAQDDVRYIPAHEILAIKQAFLTIPIGRRKLIPDQLFALDYGGRYRAFMLEVDRGTEPKTSSAARKSYASSIEMYRQMIEQNIHRANYGLKATVLILWVFSRRSNEQRFLDLVGQFGGPAKNLFCAQVMPNDRAAQTTIGSHYENNWARCQSAPVLLSRSGLKTG